MTGAYTWKRFDPGEGQDQWDTPPGHWCAWKGKVIGPTGTVDRVFVFICCPLCKEGGTVPHRIDPQGNVYPSMVCTGPNAAPGTCKLHTQPNTLEGWTFGERPDTKE